MEMIKLWSKLVEVIVTMVWMLVVKRKEEKQERGGRRRRAYLLDEINKAQENTGAEKLRCCVDPDEEQVFSSSFHDG